MDVAGPAPLSTHANLAAQMPTRAPPEVRRVDEGAASTRTRTDANTHRRQEDVAASARDLARIRQAMADPQQPTGPPPSFEVSLLEVESDLQQVIARIEAQRNLGGSGAKDAAGHVADETPRQDAPQNQGQNLR